MEPLAETPRTFRENVETDLRRAARLVNKIQDEIDWQWRLATPEGDYHLATTMPDDPRERGQMLRRIETFMLWKRCFGFIMAVETRVPDSVYAVGIGAREELNCNCLARITRHPRPWTAKNFGNVEWLPVSSIDPVIAALLPRVPRPMTPKEIGALEKWFGVTGRFPTVHVPSLEIRGL